MSTPVSVDEVAQARVEKLIPRPVSVSPGNGIYVLNASTRITVNPATPELLAVGEYLATHLRPATGYKLPVEVVARAPQSNSIHLTTVGGDPSLGEEGYELTVRPDGVVISAPHPTGLFWGCQTLRQLLPPAIERTTLQEEVWAIPEVTIRDHPRFPWRGMMLDVSRHFFGVETVQRLVDLIAFYKMNRLHLHLSDDQGWRIMIHSWPNLALYGGSTQVGGGPGGYYTQEQYVEIVAYAQSRHITVVPEIDMPGHTNAALASYPELNCDGVAPPLYTGTEVGFSSLCIRKDLTYRFVEDVVREISALTPGPYFHIGGDEAMATDPADYVAFVERVQEIVQAHGKRMIGWEEIAQARLAPTSVAQVWHGAMAQQAVQRGVKVILSPASKVYLDMKYNPSTPLGLSWAGYVEVRDAYDWDPANLLEGITEENILGVEAPLWTETIQTQDDMDWMVFPRLIGVAEIGWSPRDSRNWEEYCLRLAAHGLRLEAMGVRFYRSPQVPWE
ncbi:MAG: beta-N-acetylhexosaminidase [Anaerolineae bacterium]|nr:beta-N-acetylhexosaminidase [Anaerolineae bacterium]